MSRIVLFADVQNLLRLDYEKILLLSTAVFGGIIVRRNQHTGNGLLVGLLLDLFRCMPSWCRNLGCY